MNKLIALLVLSFVYTAGHTQETGKSTFPKTITVTGSAEMEVIPDEVYVSVTLKEYQKRGEDKRDIETLKRNFLGYCQQAGIPDSAISISSYTGFNSYYSLRKNKKRNPDLMAGITYQVKFSSSKQMDDLVDKLDDEATQSFDISYTSHSKITEFRRQLKIMAVKAAKEKAIYLTEAIGEKISGAITVKEPEEPVYGSRSNTYSVANSNISTNYYSKSVDSDKPVETEFKKMKIRYEVNVIFAIL